MHSYTQKRNFTWSRQRSTSIRRDIVKTTWEHTADKKHRRHDAVRYEVTHRMLSVSLYYIRFFTYGYHEGASSTCGSPSVAGCVCPQTHRCGVPRTKQTSVEPPLADQPRCLARHRSTTQTKPVDHVRHQIAYEGGDRFLFPPGQRRRGNSTYEPITSELRRFHSRNSTLTHTVVQNCTRSIRRKTFPHQKALCLAK